MNFQQQGKRVTIPFGESLPEGIFYKWLQET